PIDTVPGAGEPTLPTTIALQCNVSAAGAVGKLAILGRSHPGNGRLTISLSAKEALLSRDPHSNATDTPWITTRRYDMSLAWLRDVQRCNAFDLGRIHQRLKSLADLVVAAEDRPNINPAVVRELAHATREYVDVLDRLTGGSHGLDGSVAQLIRQAQSQRGPLKSFVLADAAVG